VRDAFSTTHSRWFRWTACIAVEVFGVNRFPVVSGPF
jgi:hypothetical protein